MGFGPNRQLTFGRRLPRVCFTNRESPATLRTLNKVKIQSLYQVWSDRESQVAFKRLKLLRSIFRDSSPAFQVLGRTLKNGSGASL